MRTSKKKIYPGELDCDSSITLRILVMIPTAVPVEPGLLSLES